MCKQPIKEKYLLNGALEKTNDAYAISKIAGIKMCESYNEQYGTNYKCIMPTNTYGPNDNYNKILLAIAFTVYTVCDVLE